MFDDLFVWMGKISIAGDKNNILIYWNFFTIQLYFADKWSCFVKLKQGKG